MKNKTQTSHFYSTKFVPQKTRSALVSRERLLEKLISYDNNSAAVFLIVAPAGYGKSTLLGQLMEHHLENQQQIGWLSLDESDNSTDTFINYLIEVYERAKNPTLTPTNAPSQHDYSNINPKARIKKLLNKIANEGEPIKIILDDFQVITNTELLEYIAWLLKMMPMNLKIFIISRSAPNLSVISEFRAKDQLVEISANDLNFTVHESTLFLSAKGDINLNENQIHALHTRTEGWVAATQLISHALQNQHEQEEFIQNISGTDKDIVEYLGNYVLNIQSEEVQKFFLYTSILTRLNKELCITVCGTESAAETLEYINDQGLFLFELDRERKWFRYHHLFRDFIKAELHKTQPDKYQELCFKAAVWFEKEGNIEEAIDYYLSGEVFEKASILIADQAVVAVQYNGNHSVLLKWIDRLPSQYIFKVPTIAICYIWSLLFTRNLTQGESVLEQLVEHIPEHHHDKVMVEYNVSMLTRIKEVMYGDFNNARTNISNWLEKFPDATPLEQGTILGLLGATCLHTLEFSMARRVLMQAKHTFEKIHCDYGAVWMDSLYAIVHFRQGHLLEYQNILEKALQFSNKKMGDHSLTSSMLNIYLSQVYFELNQLPLAKKHLDEGIDFITVHGVIDTVQIGFIMKAKLLERAGFVKDALNILTEGEAFGRNHNLFSFEIVLVCECIGILLRSGDTASAKELYCERGFDSICQENKNLTVTEYFQVSTITARIELADNSPSSALKLLGELAKQSKQKNYHQLLTSLLLLTASAHFDLGKKNQAFRILNQVIETSAVEGKISLFIDESYHLEALVSDFMTQRNINNESSQNESENKFCDEICKIYHLDNNTLQSDKSKIIKTEDIQSSDVLTKREKELLVLLQQGLSNKELAENLFVSESTIKWHLSRIYTKIGAKNRLDAIKLFLSHQY